MIFFIVIVCVILAVLFEIRRELSFFKTVHYKMKVSGLQDDKKIIFLSDMHNHVYGKDNSDLFEAIKTEQPDLILIGGDMLVGKEEEQYFPALDFVKRLPQICPVYYANGNHEQRMKECPENYKESFVEYKEELEKNDVQFLENSSVEFVWDNKRVKITGLEIPLRCYTHFHKETLLQNELLERIGHRDSNAYEILLAHNPSYMKNYLSRGADLILSGHLHGGIARIPGITGAISPSFELFPKYSGDHYKEGTTDIVVSKGLGTHTFNIRFLNPAEIVVLCLEGDKK